MSMPYKTLLYHYGYLEKVRKAHFLLLLIIRISSQSVLIQSYFMTNLKPDHSRDHFIPGL
jgi:hypothetical protein